jgi:hypothetical protein
MGLAGQQGLSDQKILAMCSLHPPPLPKQNKQKQNDD